MEGQFAQKAWFLSKLPPSADPQTKDSLIKWFQAHVTDVLIAGGVSLESRKLTYLQAHRNLTRTWNAAITGRHISASAPTVCGMAWNRIAGFQQANHTRHRCTSTILRLGERETDLLHVSRGKKHSLSAVVAVMVSVLKWKTWSGLMTGKFQEARSPFRIDQVWNGRTNGRKREMSFLIELLMRKGCSWSGGSAVCCGCCWLSYARWFPLWGSIYIIFSWV